MKYVVFCMLLCTSFLVCENEKTYDLTWRFRKGLVNIMPNKSVIKTEMFVVENGKENLIDSEISTAQATAHWTVERVIRDRQAAVLNIIEGQKLNVTKNGEVYKYNSNQSWDDQDPILQKYKMQVGVGVAFLLDIKNQKVLVTWDLLPQKNGTYKREMVRGKTDPYEMGISYKQLVNKKVAIGHTWELERKLEQGFVYKYKYTFSKIIKYKKKPVAKIDVTGGIFWGNTQLGTIKGEMLHDYKTRLMRKHKMLEKIEQITTKNGKKYIRRMEISSEWRLKKTNATKK